MKEIGQTFKEKREEIGITIEEVANDLKTDTIVIENLEAGNHKVFRDIIELKEMISNYAKYLGLDDTKLKEELEDFLFETTSKIDIEDIKERLKQTKKEEKKIKTPYTIEVKTKKSNSMIVVIILMVIVLLVFYIFLSKFFF